MRYTERLSIPSIEHAESELRRVIDELGLGRDPGEFPWFSPSYKKSIRSQGFKLHLSATPDSAAALLMRVGPELARRTISFKVVGELGFLERLNMGHFGYSQVGKFITVYPDSDAEAIIVADFLMNLTTKIAGPHVPSDRRIHPSKVLHYRYGSFVRPSKPTERMTISRPDGTMMEDHRDPATPVPVWLTDPIAKRFGLDDRGNANHLNRFVFLHVYRQRPGGGVYLAADLHHASQDGRKGVAVVVLKEGRAFGEQRFGGADAQQRLQWEASVLRTLATSGVTPRLIDILNLSSSTFLTLEHVSHQSLEDRLREGTRLSSPQLFLLQLIAAVSKIHALGVFHCDLSPANLCIQQNGSIIIIDFENAVACSRPDRIDWEIGTVGCFPSLSQLYRFDRDRDRWPLLRDLFAIGAIALAIARPRWFLSLLDAADTPPVDWDIPEAVHGLPSSVGKFINRACMLDEPFDSLTDMKLFLKTHPSGGG